jgi:hypothetical protein
MRFPARIAFPVLVVATLIICSLGVRTELTTCESELRYRIVDGHPDTSSLNIGVSLP